MKLKDFIENLSKYDQESEVMIYTEDPYEGYRNFKAPLFYNEMEDFWNGNIEIIGDILYIGGQHY